MDAHALEIVEIALSDEPAAARRTLIGERLLRLLRADTFSSYVCDTSGPYADPVAVNLGADMLQAYDRHYRHVDSLTPELFQRRRTSAVTTVRRSSDEFVDGFLHAADMYHGMNYHPGRPGVGSIDLRVWRGRRGASFTDDDVRALQIVGDLLDRLWPVEAPSTLLPLTPRESQIAALIAEGLSDKEICVELAISAPTLRTHLGKAFAKTGARNRASLAVAYRSHHRK